MYTHLKRTFQKPVRLLVYLVEDTSQLYEVEWLLMWLSMRFLLPSLICRENTLFDNPV